MEHPVRKLRHERNLTLEEAALQLGTSKGNLSRIETGAHGAGPELIRRIQDWSGGKVTPNDMFAFDPGAQAVAQ